MSRDGTEADGDGVEKGPRNDDLAGRVIGAAIEVHRWLGPGLLESAYEECLGIELRRLEIAFERQKALAIEYKGEQVVGAYRLDLIVEGELIVELKAVEKVEAVHSAQVLTYLRLSGLRTGLLINFNVPFLKDGVKRISL